MRLLIRLLGLLVLAGAFAALIVDGTRSVAAGAPALLPFGSTLTAFSPDGFQSFHAAVARKLPVLWDPVLATAFLLPTWLVLGVVGLALMAVTRRRRPTIGYVRR